MFRRKVSDQPEIRFRLSGVWYRWNGWAGCQLESHEWRMVPAGTQRVLNLGVGKESVTVTVFTAKREGLKVRTTWAISSRGSTDEHNARIRGLKKAISDLV